MNTPPKVGWIHIWCEAGTGNSISYIGVKAHEGIYLGQHGNFYFWKPLHFIGVPPCPRTSPANYTVVTPVIEMKASTTQSEYHDYMFND